jgi:hypothetical protein
MDEATEAAATATEEQRTPLVFPKPTTQLDFTERLKKIRRGDWDVTSDIPGFFARESSQELREAALSQLDLLSQRDRLIIGLDCQTDWEDLIIYLKTTNSNLLEKALGNYLFQTNCLLILPALRFAIKLTSCHKHGSISGDDDKIIKVIYNRIKHGNFGFYDWTISDKAKQLHKTQYLDGLFGILPEIKPVLQAMLNKLFHFHGIFYPNDGLRIDYDSRDFIQVERALKIIIGQRQYDTSFLPFIKKMTVMHRDLFKEIRSQVRHNRGQIGSFGNTDYNILEVSADQGILNETLGLLEKADQELLKNGEKLRQDRLREYEEDFEKK